ncbi:COG5001 Predicted signal transduction protein containing a membrane domain, an EAL and a GGDEF domain [Rhabdaerophilaceae bacterium]
MSHKILLSQLVRCTKPDDTVDLDRLCDLVSKTYAQFDTERSRSERANRLMAEELAEADRHREAMLQTLKHEHTKLDIALEHMMHSLAMFDAEQRLVVANRLFLNDITPKGEVEPSTYSEAIALLRRQLVDGHPPLKEIPKLIVEGVSSVQAVHMRDGRIMQTEFQSLERGGWVQVMRDVTKERLSDERIRYLAEHDALTGLANRSVFNRCIAEKLHAAIAEQTCAVLCLDLDHFKTVNDTLGHPVGDGLLRTVADRLRAMVGHEGLIARLGGDEFAILDFSRKQPANAIAMAERILAEIQKPCLIDGHTIEMRVSIGIAIGIVDGETDEVLMRNADIALYRAKAEGRGIFRRFETGMDQALLARRQKELDLRRALRLGEFELFYQPLLNMLSRSIESCEALIRWNHPEHGLVSPNDFIPLAEEVGLIVEIGEWTLMQACQAASKWPDHIGVAVNVSPAQFRSQKLLQTVRRALRKSGLDASRLELEITESVLLSDTDRTLEILHDLRSLGVRIAMDDFGTGYSSLSYLRRFPFDKLKIDRSFIGDIAHNAEAGAIVRSIIQLANALGMATTAEGVEHNNQRDMLDSLNCKEIQGFLISRPVPVERLIALLAPPIPKAAVA